MKVNIGTAVLDCIVHEVEHYVGDVHLVSQNHGVLCFQFEVDATLVTLYLQCKGVNHAAKHLVSVYLSSLEPRLLPVEHRHLKNLFHLEAQAFCLVVDNRRNVAEHGRRLAEVRIVQHLGCQ